jgi:hypothetical protein
MVCNKHKPLPGYCGLAIEMQGENKGKNNSTGQKYLVTFCSSMVSLCQQVNM